MEGKICFEKLPPTLLIVTAFATVVLAARSCAYIHVCSSRQKIKCTLYDFHCFVIPWKSRATPTANLGRYVINTALGPPGGYCESQCCSLWVREPSEASKQLAEDDKNVILRFWSSSVCTLATVEYFLRQNIYHSGHSLNWTFNLADTQVQGVANILYAMLVSCWLVLLHT